MKKPLAYRKLKMVDGKLFEYRLEPSAPSHHEEDSAGQSWNCSFFGDEKSWGFEVLFSLVPQQGIQVERETVKGICAMEDNNATVRLKRVFL